MLCVCLCVCLCAYDMVLCCMVVVVCVYVPGLYVVVYMYGFVAWFVGLLLCLFVCDCLCVAQRVMVVCGVLVCGACFVVSWLGCCCGLICGVDLRCFSV